MIPRNRSICLAVLLVLLGGLPLLAGGVTPLQDWPNHLARVQIVDAMRHGDLFWARFYQPGSFMVPDVALDAGLLGLLWLGLGIVLAAKVFLVVTYLVFVGGVCALAWALRAYDPVKIVLAAVLFTSGALLWGLVDYMLGIGVALALLAVWINAERPLRHLGIAMAGVAVLFFCHLIAAVVFVVLLGCFAAVESLAARPRRLPGASAVAALAVLLALRSLSPVAGEGLFDMVYAGHESWAGMMHHKFSIIDHALRGGGAAVDAATLTILLAAVALLAVAARLRLAWSGAAAIAVLLVMVLTAPERIGTGSLLDFRLMVVPLLLAVAAVRIEWRARVGRRIVQAALAFGLGAHSLLLGTAWMAAASEFRAFDRLAAQWPPGGIAVMGFATPLSRMTFYDFWSPPLTSIETQVVRRHVFVPMIFANPTQQPLALRPEFAGLNQPFDLSGPEGIAASRLRLATLCAAWPSVHLTVLYPQPWLRAALPPLAMQGGTADFMLLDGCALGGAWAVQLAAGAGT